MSQELGGAPAATASNAGEISEDALKAAEKFIEEDEGALNRVGGWIGYLIAALAIGSTLFHLYAAYDIIPTHVLRPGHVGIVLVLTFLLFPIASRFRDQIRWWDWLFAAAGAGTVGYILYQGADFGDYATAPTEIQVWVGIVFIALVLEATRRTTGIIMPIVAMAFVLYAIYGQHLPAPWTHRGYDVDRLVAHLYMTLEGIFGSAVDVSSSLIILFTIFGAVLQASGAGKFFIDFSFAAMGGRRNSAGRAVVLSSFLMGGPSGSGVATTVTIGTVAHPMLAKSGYDKNAAGGLLAAGGLGAIISPPVLGAAAFLIAEYLKISYIEVIWMAIIPTLLYYFGIYVMVELDAKKYGAGGSDLLIEKGTLWKLTKGYWFHFLSLISIVVFMLMGFSPVLAVFWATIMAILVSYFRWDTALWPRKLAKALTEGTTGVLNVAPTCAAAGIIVGSVTLTGLAQKFADIIITYAGGSLILTAIYTSLIVWIVGLAVPVTASYILCAVIAAPALIKLGVPDFAAHMFIFYYAVLSEVSPPTALSPFAAAAITGGNPYATTLQSWKYTMPAFLVPFVFVLDPLGIGLLLKFPDGATWFDILEITLQVGAGIALLAFAFQRYYRVRTNGVETALFSVAGLLLVLPTIVTAILKPIIGIDISGYMPLFPQLGVHVGYNVVLAVLLFLAAHTMQRTRTVAPATA
ncbi:TRAP transporter fused permease subunit [Hyphomicrobium sp. CS1BSMeth3]|uniref:TRAP transporter permease n=1 Tax=Hyphomicrobium sp. CS1BSMeth3 TaxID=1892844 RepID=UPI0009306BE2|nr:TRAP transporter fused permease subunit [Hyphomicrobium sp. CS1BSMeth3]